MLQNLCVRLSSFCATRALTVQNQNNGHVIVHVRPPRTMTRTDIRTETKYDSVIAVGHVREKRPVHLFTVRHCLTQTAANFIQSNEHFIRGNLSIPLK